MRTVGPETSEVVQNVIFRELPGWIEQNPALRKRLWEALREASQTEGEPVPPSPMTYEEFLGWADEDTLAEWVDGEVRMYSPASKRHQAIADFFW